MNIKDIVAGHVRGMTDEAIAAWVREMDDDKLFALAAGSGLASNGAAKPAGDHGEAIVDAVISGHVSAAAIMAATGLGRGVVGPTLRALKESGRLYQAGDRRWARYGVTQADADSAHGASRAE